MRLEEGSGRVDGRRWTGFSTDPLAIRHHQCVVDLLEQAGIAKDREPVEHPALRRKLPRQKTPGDAAMQCTEDRVHNFAHAPFMRSLTPADAARRLVQPRPDGHHDNPGLYL